MRYTSPGYSTQGSLTVIASGGWTDSTYSSTKTYTAPSDGIFAMMAAGFNSSSLSASVNGKTISSSGDGKDTVLAAYLKKDEVINYTYYSKDWGGFRVIFYPLS